MGVYFLKDLGTTKLIHWRCLFCGSIFPTKYNLDDHYFTVHRNAFTEDELSEAEALRSGLLKEQKPRAE